MSGAEQELAVQPEETPGSLRSLALLFVACVPIALAVFASFRGSLAGEPLAAWEANGPRVLLGAAAGALLGVAGALRLRTDPSAFRPEQALRRAGVVVGAAGAAASAAWFVSGRFGLVLAVALFGGATGYVMARTVERPARGANLVAAALLFVSMFVLTFAFTTTRLAEGGTAPLIGWLVADLSWATPPAALAMLAIAVVAVAFAARMTKSSRAPVDPQGLALALDGLATAAAGPILAVAELVPRLVARLAGGSGGAAFPVLCAAVGAGGVSLSDALTRQFVGGFAPPLNTAILFATPLFLVWNRARLRREAGPASPVFAALEWAVIAFYAVFAVAVVSVLSGIVAEAY